MPTGSRGKGVSRTNRGPQQTAGALVIGGLQKRLLSSIEAFAKTLAVHRKSVERALERAAAAPAVSAALQVDLERLTAGADPDAGIAAMADFDSEIDAETDSPDDAERSDPSELDFADLMTTATAASADSSRTETRAALMRELAFVDEMRDVAEASRYDADPRVRKIIEWIEANMCPGLSAPGATLPQWNNRRLLIFTEYEDTRRWLQRCLNEAIAHSDRASERIAVFTGMTSRHRREDIKHAFNTEPGDHPLRILIATDAAREGLNLQRHCHDLFHFDLPWNPSRLDQRNGRIDRKLQPADEVFCRYFMFAQRPEDRILQVLVNKVERIRQELGSVAKVLEGRIARAIGAQGMRRDGINNLAAFIGVYRPANNNGPSRTNSRRRVFGSQSEKRWCKTRRGGRVGRACCPCPQDATRRDRTATRRSERAPGQRPWCPPVGRMAFPAHDDASIAMPPREQPFNVPPYGGRSLEKQSSDPQHRLERRALSQQQDARRVQQYVERCYERLRLPHSKPEDAWRKEAWAQWERCAPRRPGRA